MSEQPEDKAASDDVSEPPAPATGDQAELAAPGDDAKLAAPGDDAKPEAAASAEPKTSVQRSDDEDDAALDAAGRERPRFLLAFPEDPELARLSAAFEAGNYALVRAEAEALAERTESPAVRDAALELRRRIEPDPLAKYLLALTTALLLFLAYFAYNH
jgi:hypothetical protein